MLEPYLDVKAIGFRGGAITVREKALLQVGSFSMVQNLRPQHPGFIKRPGQSALHTVADSTNQVLSLYQFSKQRISEYHVFAQMSDGDILDATTAPPGITTGAFGSEVLSGSSGQRAAAWATLGDFCIFSNGVDQHQIYTGNESYVRKFVKYSAGAAAPSVPEVGFDYSDEVSDGNTSTLAILDSLDTYAAATWECVFICTPVPANGIKFYVTNGNDTASVADIYYKKDDGTWADCNITDGTDVGGDTLKQTGSMTWTQPTDEITSYMYGVCGYWYRLQVSVQLDSEVEINKVTFQSSFQDIQNVWNGVIEPAVEVRVEGTTQWYTYASGAVDLDALTSGKKIVIATADPIEGIYIDPGGTPNATGTAITSLKYWDGDSWVSVGTTTDATSGMSNAGWITFPRQSLVEPLQFEGSQFYAYWYELIWDSAISADVLVAIDVMPYFDVDDFGNSYSCCAWKDRIAYSFDRYGEYIYVCEANNPMTLNGLDYAILEAGDGRPHKIACMKKFHNELLVWQEEKGTEGGTITLFEGYSPSTFGKLIISSKIGSMNNKSVVVVDGVTTSTKTDERIQTLAFFLSRYGVYVTDGRTAYSKISADIQNYFDPTQSECIRYGYEKEMWLEHDPAFNIIRIGLVSGSSATLPNVFLAYDLEDRCWYFDDLAQELSCMTNVEAGSGNVPIISIGGGIDDGFVYHLNNGQNDVSTAIDSYLSMELHGEGEYVVLRELLLRMKAQSAGSVTITVSKNDIQAFTKTLSMIAEVTSQVIRRHRISTNVVDQHITIKIQHNTVDQDCYLEDFGVSMSKWKNR